MLRWCTLAAGVCLIASTYTQADTIGSRPCASCLGADAPLISRSGPEQASAATFDAVAQELTVSARSGQSPGLEDAAVDGTDNSASDAEQTDGFRSLVIASVASELMTSDLQDSANTFYIAGTGTEDEAQAESIELPPERPGPSPQPSQSSVPGPSLLVLLGTFALGVAGALKRMALEPRDAPEEAAKEARPTA